MSLSLLLTLLTLILTPTLLNADCINQPSDPNCKDYKMPDDQVLALKNKMCTAYPDMYMAGCSVNKICEHSEYQSAYPQYCDHFSIYKEMCMDMPPMDECVNYNKMCVNTSVVLECNTKVLPLLKSSRQYGTLIDKICVMDMDGCDVCKNDKRCDKLKIYSRLCMQMPDMVECGNWHEICKVVPNWPICGGGDEVVPSMKMYFHTGIAEYMLFQTWVPKDMGQYWLALVITFVVSVGYEFLKLWRNKIKREYDMTSYENKGLLNHSKVKNPNNKLFYVLKTSFVYFIEITIGFLLMLLVMTYNVGVCLAIVVGRFVGSIISGLIDDNNTPHLSHDAPESGDCH